MADLLSRLNSSVMIVEGGISTMLDRMGVGDMPCPELLNVMEPELIEEIHRSFYLAGANCAISNTFGASRTRLKKHGLEKHLEDLNRRGVQIAKRGNPMHVLGDMGLCAIKVEKKDSQAFKDAYLEYQEQAASLASEEPDAIYIETIPSALDALCALEATKSVCDLPVIVGLSVSLDSTLSQCGTPLREAVNMLEDSGADVIGINCVLDANNIFEVAKNFSQTTSLPILICPDVPRSSPGLGKTLAKAQIFASMEKMAQNMRQFGFSMIGSCCGSTPYFTGAIYAAIGDSAPIQRKI